MAFFSRIRGEFDRDTAVNGYMMHTRGKVEVLEGTPHLARARVGGASMGHVCTLHWKHEALRVGCTCLDFLDFDPCEHVYAALMTAEKRGFLSAMPERGKIDLLVDEDLLDEADETATRHDQKARTNPGSSRSNAPQRPKWLEALNQIELETRSERARDPRAKPISGDVVYELGSESNSFIDVVQIQTLLRKRNASGEPKAPVRYATQRSQIPALENPQDRRILNALHGRGQSEQSWSYRYEHPARDHFEVDALMLEHLLPWLCETGRFFFRAGPSLLCGPLSFDESPPWDLRLHVRRGEASENLFVEARILRGGVLLERSTIRAILRSGFVITEDKIARINLHDASPWMQIIRSAAAIEVPKKDEAKLLEILWTSEVVPPVDWPEDLAFEKVELKPKPCLKLRPGPNEGDPRAKLAADIGFRYGEVSIRARHSAPHLPDIEKRKVLVRDRAAESQSIAQLSELGFRDPPRYVVQSSRPDELHDLEIVPGRVPKAVRLLVQSGWHVEAEGKLYRQPGAFKMSVSSGVDWFDVNAEVDFEGQIVQLPALLKALKRGEASVVLGDGTIGMLPEEWLKKYGLLLETGKTEGGSVRFGRSQVGLLDALLAAQPEVSVDETFERARKELREFDGVQPIDAPESFRGELRPYQQEGLGWMHFLRRFGLGGCLADDMGLGKTVQVLAMLEARRNEPLEKSTSRAPSLVVVPRSLIFNWKSEAARFAPGLRILDHSGIDRVKSLDHLTEYDLVLTTYGTLRRDVPYLKDFTFEHVILDEAQAIKNAESESAKAARLLKARHRLILSGTPIENHMGELWSLFEFLNPGMLGGSSVLRMFAGGSGRSIDPEVLPVLQSALRPFILRRKKEQVAKDLPQKLEQTLFCELEADEKRRYDELRDHYRAKVLGMVDEEGLNKVQFHVLEALLRLRQAACHPGLIDKALKGESSAKLDVLLSQLRQVWEEGHKALVFSQFTQFLGILKEHLDREGIPYEYLDGKTKDRQARVDRFQTDPDCKLFLISLKAGGLGLNLTAAEYVFLLDPWWNPAVEAQAIDRAHRIGQTRRVFAYRIVTRGTVEEKVLELQSSKRDLADAIINAQNNGLKGLSREDLERLLS